MCIEKASKVMTEFLKKNLGRVSRIIKMAKTETGWTGEAEVYEESSFIKSLGLATRVQDRNIYEVVMTNDFEVVAFKQKKDDTEDES